MSTALLPPGLDPGHLAFHINTVLCNGPRAELRRLDPDRAATWPATFWKMWATRIEPFLGASPEEHQRTWAALCCGMAILDHSQMHPGTALAQASYSELRLNRLLSARDDHQIHEFLSAVRFLNAKKISADWNQLSQLIRHEPDSVAGDRCRRHIASAFYRTLASPTSKD